MVRLRPLNPVTDAATAWSWYRDPEVLWGAENTTEPFSLERVQRMYEVLSARGEAYVIEVWDGRSWLPVGDAALMPESCPIVVGDARWRGHGVGRQALAFLIARARHLGWGELRVRSIFVDNVASVALYEGMGFEPVAESHPPGGRAFRSYRLPLNPA
jgi:GNAT superfamily N-acetyltransferase